MLPYDNLEQCLKIFSTEGEEDARRGDGDKEQRNGEEVEQAARDVGGWWAESPPGHDTEHEDWKDVEAENCVHWYAPPSWNIQLIRSVFEMS